MIVRTSADAQGYGVKFRLVINPQSDLEFATHVQRIAGAGHETPDELRNVLQWTYPQAMVHSGLQDADGTQRWYVYRDGHWTEQRR